MGSGLGPPTAPGSLGSASAACACQPAAHLNHSEVCFWKGLGQGGGGGGDAAAFRERGGCASLSQSCSSAWPRRSLCPRLGRGPVETWSFYQLLCRERTSHCSSLRLFRPVSWTPLCFFYRGTKAGVAGRAPRWDGLCHRAGSFLLLPCSWGWLAPLGKWLLRFGGMAKCRTPGCCFPTSPHSASHPASP